MGSRLLSRLCGSVSPHLTVNPISMPVLIGLLILLGSVAKNSSLLVDFAIEEMNRGAEKYAAIVEAGHKRAQPIVMTTVAMVAGMLPVAFSFSGDGSWRAPMGITVIGGLILRSEEHTSELQSLMRISYAVFCLNKKNAYNTR